MTAAVRAWPRRRRLETLLAGAQNCRSALVAAAIAGFAAFEDVADMPAFVMKSLIGRKRKRISESAQTLSTLGCGSQVLPERSSPWSTSLKNRMTPILERGSLARGWDVMPKRPGIAIGAHDQTGSFSVGREGMAASTETGRDVALACILGAPARRPGGRPGRMLRASLNRGKVPMPSTVIAGVRSDF